MDISEATLQNWQRLQVCAETRLRHRANKSRSSKRIYPAEYVSSRESLKFADAVIDLSVKHQISREDVIFSLAVQLLENKQILYKDHVQKCLCENPRKEYAVIRELDIPQNEQDILGFVYQCLLLEGEKSAAGSYYTPRSIVENMLSGWKPSLEKNFCDPCCGSGAFLLAIPVSSPEQLWGCDKDPVAVFIAKVNLLCKFSEYEFSPQIFCCDYLAERELFTDSCSLFSQKFDLIATNPPWGAEKNKKSRKGESFSHFFCRAFEQLKEGGKISFLLPEAVLRIKTHTKLRQFILQKRLEKIVLYSGSFTGVMTKYVAIQAAAALPEESFELHCGGIVTREKIAYFQNSRDCAFAFLSGEDREIIAQIQRCKHFYLNSDGFALGIVTGDNKGKVKRVCEEGMEKVFTGKEISRYVLKTAVNFLRYDRSGFQQAAPDEYYRAPEKLVYKFISNEVVFAYDNTGSLFLNSANILIPEIPGMSIKTVLAFLNSNVLRYYYKIMFGDVKILKGNLMQLPFPEIPPETAEKIDRLIDAVLNGGCDCEEQLQNIIYACYQLSDKQISVIEGYFRKTNAESKELDFAEYEVASSDILSAIISKSSKAQ